MASSHGSIATAIYLMEFRTSVDMMLLRQQHQRDGPLYIDLHEMFQS